MAGALRLSLSRQILRTLISEIAGRGGHACRAVVARQCDQVSDRRMCLVLSCIAILPHARATKNESDKNCERIFGGGRWCVGLWHHRLLQFIIVAIVYTGAAATDGTYPVEIVPQMGHRAP
jgi:hypothetical protein